MLQTVFSNPLAGPSVLGIDSGASLGVALVMLSLGGTVGGGLALTGYLAVVAGAFAGAASILGIIIFFSTLVRSNVMLLIIGIMVGYLASSMISLLNFFATSDGVYSYMLWGMGDFSGVSLRQMPLFALLIGTGLFVALLLMKPLNALLLGERYAENLGVRVQRVRILLLISTGVLTAVVDGFLRPDLVYRTGRASSGPADDRLVEPQAADAGGDPADRLRPSRWPCNLVSTAARRIGRAAAERYHAGSRRSGDYLCDRESEKNPIFQLMEPTGTCSRRAGPFDRLSGSWPERRPACARAPFLWLCALGRADMPARTRTERASRRCCSTLGGLQRTLLDGRAPTCGGEDRSGRYGARDPSLAVARRGADRPGRRPGGLRVRRAGRTRAAYPYTGFFGRLDAAGPAGRRTEAIAGRRHEQAKAG